MYGHFEIGVVLGIVRGLERPFLRARMSSSTGVRPIFTVISTGSWARLHRKQRSAGLHPCPYGCGWYGFFQQHGFRLGMRRAAETNIPATAANRAKGPPGRQPFRPAGLEAASTQPRFCRIPRIILSVFRCSIRDSLLPLKYHEADCCARLYLAYDVPTEAFILAGQIPAARAAAAATAAPQVILSERPAATLAIAAWGLLVSHREDVG